MGIDGDRAPDSDDEHVHPDAAAEEWLFTCWRLAGNPPGSGGEPVGVISGYRINRGPARQPNGWYWAALVRPGRPVLHVADWDVPPRRDPLLVKGDGLWADHVCDAALQQWTVTNETYATALEEPDDAFGRAYGTTTAIAFDLEWYAVAPARLLPAGTGDDGTGYEQAGVVHGTLELGGSPAIELEEVPAHRWHRWGRRLAPVTLPPAYAHTGARAPFAFPDGSRSDWALTPDGWRAVPAG